VRGGPVPFEVFLDRVGELHVSHRSATVAGEVMVMAGEVFAELEGAMPGLVAAEAADDICVL
jgi:hypothetical protein